MFPGDDFLLESDLAAALYHDVAAPLPCVDFHCHLPPGHVADDHRFRSLTEIWLDGDHYKWRAMRTAGVPERLITGPADDWTRFEAWARTVPLTIGNPLFHWTCLELRRSFGITDRLDPSTARSIYDRANAWLAGPAGSVLGLLAGFNVEVVCTTDDPADALDAHHAHAASRRGGPAMFPTWRPDRALGVEDAATFNVWVNRLEVASGTAIGGFGAFWDALERRHQAFHDAGCRASDHGLDAIDAEPCADADLVRVFDRVRAGTAASPAEARTWRSGLLHRFALMDESRGWVQQYHLGALRNNNTRLLRALGADSGCDSIGDAEQARPLSRFLDRLDAEGRLARTILYNLNPRDNELFATMIGNFQDGSLPGKLQYGPAWWFLDQRDGMEAQLRALANMGLLATFVGMVTDSRSFLSYSRHEYFRRILCNFLGDQVRRGWLPPDRDLLDPVVRGVCYGNAKAYFRFPAAATR
jgi:glucuronate isomerase